MKPLTFDTAKITTHWRSTAIGLAILLLSIKSSIHFDVAGHLTMTEKDWFGVGCGLVAQGIAVFQKDAGVTEAVTPSGEVKAVESHETPNDPKNTAVTE